MGKTQYRNFTKKFLEGLSPEERRYNVFDTSTRGLGICVYPSGAKTFFHLKKVQGWPERTTIGPFPDLSPENARGKASELNGKLSKWKSNNYEGQSPLEQRAKVPTFGEVLEDYVERHLKPNAKDPIASVRYAHWQFDFYLASWRNRPISSITRKDVRDKHSEIGAKNGKISANRVVTFIRTLFNHAVHPDVALWEGANPARNPKKFLFHEESRERTIKDEEAPKFFEELAREPNIDLQHFTLLALATGARRGTILAMEWKQLDIPRQLWTIPNPKGKKNNSNPHIVPLSDLAIAVLNARPRVSDQWVFPGTKSHLTTLKKPWARFIKRTGIKERLVIHDLRRSLATREGDIGAATEVIQKTLNHTEASAATRIYDRSDRREDVRAAMDAAIHALLAAGKTSKRKLLSAAAGAS